MERRAFVQMVVASLLSVCCTALQAAASNVDVAIAFAVDVSASVDSVTAGIQRKGHAAAITAPDVMNAIAMNYHRCISITYFEWSGPGHISVVVPWTDICDLRSAEAVALTIEREGDTGVGRSVRRATSISAAIDVGILLLDRFPGKAARKVIDISTNGENNDGLPVETSRLKAIAKGLTINAIAIPTPDCDLYRYVKEQVIGGPQAFAMRLSRTEDYTNALRRKLVTEITLSEGSANVP
jgi:hypothetical protein